MPRLVRSVRAARAQPAAPGAGAVPHFCSIIPVGIFLLALVLGLCALVPATRAATQVGSAPYKVSATGAGNSYAPVFSADGNHVAFVSHANNLVTNDDLGPHLDLFLRDLVASNTVLVSVSSNGFGGANDNIGLYTLSSNAQVIAFDTTANNLAPGDINRVSDIYVRDLVAGTTRLLTAGADGPSFNPLISEDGQRVIFESLAWKLVTNDFNRAGDIFIHDLTTGITELVSMNAEGTASPDGPSHSPSISADGLTVAFVSHATNLVEGVTNTAGEIYSRSVPQRTTRWAVASHIREAHPRFQGNRPYQASSPSISRDGRFVTYRTLGAFIRFDLNRDVNYTYLTYTNRFTPDGVRVDFYEFADNPRPAPNYTGPEHAVNLDSRILFHPEFHLGVETPHIQKLYWDQLVTNVSLSLRSRLHLASSFLPT